MDNTELAPAAPMLRSQRLCDVGNRMERMLVDVARQVGRPDGQVASINDTLWDWRTAVTQVSTVATWRARIGRSEDFPLHLPTDVERAMEEEIADLRAQLGQRDAGARTGGKHA